MENAKNTFYITLRNRLAALNPARIVTLRGITRPGILVEENELVNAQTTPDIFLLRWGKTSVDTDLPQALVQLECEIAYATCGTLSNAGIDRGWMLTAMDAELIAMLSPDSAPKLNYAHTPPIAMATAVFWTGPVFQPAVTRRDQLSRTAIVRVFTYQEPGER